MNFLLLSLFYKVARHNIIALHECQSHIDFLLRVYDLRRYSIFIYDHVIEEEVLYL